MRYAFIEEHRTTWPVSVQCRVLKVTRSGYYAWRQRPPSATARRRAELTEAVRRVHDDSRQVYGSPRVHAELVAQGHPCSVNTVAKVMKDAGLQAKTVRKFCRTTDSQHGHPVAENVVDRDFTPSARNQTWVADISYIPTREGWLYLAAVLDLYSRKIVGWAMSERIDSRLVVDALTMAVCRELPGEGLVAHSDRGVQYASAHYRQVLATHGITCSMSHKGNCWDNAPMESFFASLKKELVHHEDYQTRDEARHSLFEYIEVFYNRQRRHSALGHRSPAEFSQAA